MIGVRNTTNGHGPDKIGVDGDVLGRGYVYPPLWEDRTVTAQQGERGPQPACADKTSCLAPASGLQASTFLASKG